MCRVVFRLYVRRDAISLPSTTTDPSWYLEEIRQQVRPPPTWIPQVSPGVIIRSRAPGPTEPVHNSTAADRPSLRERAGPIIQELLRRRRHRPFVAGRILLSHVAGDRYVFSSVVAVMLHIRIRISKQVGNGTPRYVERHKWEVKTLTALQPLRVGPRLQMTRVSRLCERVYESKESRRAVTRTGRIFG